jgi:hypothetical protein
MLPDAIPWIDVRKRNETLKPLRAFFDSIKNDLKTKEALKLFAENEVSSVKFLENPCAVLSAPEQASRAPGRRHKPVRFGSETGHSAPCFL